MPPPETTGDALTEVMNAAAIAAAAVILDIYSGPFAATAKPDGSPVTAADQRAEAVILAHLASTGLPVLAEESAAAGRVPALGSRFFVVDPLDGTREFVKRNGEFAVNIALCEAGRPVRGVVMAPVSGEICWGGPHGAYAAQVDGGSIGVPRRLQVTNAGPLKIVASRSHGHAALARLCDIMQVEGDVSVGSSLKFCLLAKGEAQLYPRFTPTSEWDTAAGQAILEAAGGVVLDLEGRPLTCGHAENDYLNSYFIAAASRDLALRAAAEMRRLTA